MSEWLTPAQAAERVKISRKTIYAAIRAGQLRAARFGAGRREFRTNSEWLSEWLDRLAPVPQSGSQTSEGRTAC